MIVVVGNDSCWNAEHQIQLRTYGKERAHDCELAGGTRYDLAVAALGGYGELVTKVAELQPALQRAFASGKPACVNVMIQRLAAPTVTAGAAGAAN
jgi:acetolactate synthase-1/2/3 large subunit